MRPSPLLVLLFLAALATALLPLIVSPQLAPVWLMTVAALLFLAGLDVIAGLPARRLEARLTVPDLIPLGQEAEAVVAFDARGAFRRTRIRALLDVEGGEPPDAVTTRLGKGGVGEARLLLAPRRRGVLRFPRLWLGWTGPLGLMRRTKRVRIDAETRVVPNVAAARSQALRLFRHRDAWVGQKVVRHVGEGSEFEAIREYVPGLDPRALNWKASARHRQMLANEYRDERNHQLVLAIDTGHLMGAPLAGVPKLDHAATAGLVLAYASLRHGDRVGAFTFDEGVRDWLEPRGSLRTFARLQRFTADAAYGTAETNYTLGLAELSARLHRRSFVVVFTEFVDTVTAELMVENVARLAKRHLVTFVTFRDPYLHRRIDRTPAVVEDVYGAIVADDFARERDLVLHRLHRLGVFCIEADPSELSSRLVNRWLDVKRRELVG